ncbi:hypothetical protein [Sulfurisoma sediminicola]|uniref:Hemolysin type calcium-binding protein n=1 Tax=Sulfurisoma sediminicola TaxID=1381557 RepID=A0A497X700_9PROT|nr:hypothetical protein [Sulfurisoma sediminicola]RLJ61235.1 hypothetical protein DFR35_2914 [Sulfurisoma sediminicola]
MPSILDYYQYSQLATAAYIDLDKAPRTDGAYLGSTISLFSQGQGRLPTPIANLLFDKDSTDAKKAGVTSVWTIPTSALANGNYNGYYGNDDTGFAATLFQKDGQKVLAIRGTEPPGIDLLVADIGQIGYLGFALSQTASMINHILRLTTAADDMTRQYGWAFSTTRPDPATCPSVPVSGGIGYIYLTDKDPMRGLDLIGPGEKITVTGHSLGGHLAVMAARLFPNLVDAAYTYNAPGFDPSSAANASLAAYFGALAVSNPVAAAAIVAAAAVGGTVANRLTEPFVQLMKSYLPQQPASSFAGLTLHNLDSEDSVPGDDASLVAGYFTNATIYGDKTLVTTEGNSHLIEPLTDNFAVHALFYRMNTALTIADTNRILDAASARPEDTDEILVDALYKLLVNSDSAKRLVPDNVTSLEENDLGPLIGKGRIEKRQAFYSAVLEIENALKSKTGLTLVSLANKSADALKGLAVNGDTDAPAYRYALRELNPFAILGDNSLYTKFNQNGELDLFNATTGQGELTEDWLSDSAKFLHWANIANTADSTSLDGTRYGYRDTRNWRYRDEARDYSVLIRGQGFPGTAPESQVIFGKDGADPDLKGGDQGDRIHGNLGDDTLHGNGGGDTLEGNGGDDTLYGDAGTDLLLGGTGDDILEGGKEADILKGGLGSDTYVLKSGDGWDTIEDSDGLGRITYDGVQLTGGEKIADQVWKQTVNGQAFYFILTDWTEDGQTFKRLAIAGTAGGAFVNRYQAGTLGLTLPGAMTPPPELAPAAVEPVTRTSAWYNQDHTVIDARGLPAMEIQAVGDYGEVWGSGRLYGNASDNYLHNGEGDDELYGYGARDTLAGKSRRWRDGNIPSLSAPATLRRAA